MDTEFYSLTRNHLQTYIENELPVIFSAWTKSTTEPLLSWYTTTYNEILKIRKDDDNRHQKIIDLLQNQLPTLEKTIDSIKNDIGVKWIQQLLASTETVPEFVEEKQSLARYKTTKNDSLWIKFGKNIKRIKKDTFGIKPRIQQIPLRDILKLEILENSYVTEKLLTDQYTLVTSTLDYILELEHSLPVEYPDKKSEKYTDEFRIETILFIENHLQQGVQLLKKGVSTDTQKLIQLYEGCLLKAVKTDTIELNTSLFSSKTIEKRKQKVLTRARQNNENWYNYAYSQYTDFCIQIEIATFGISASIAQKKVLEITHQFFRDFFYIPLEEGVTYLRKIKTNLTENKAANSVLGKESEQIRKKLQTDLQHLFLPKILQIDEQDKTVSEIEKTLSELQLQTNGFTEKMKLSKERKIEGNSVSVLFDTISWRSLASRFFKESALRELDPSEKNLRSLSDTISDYFEEAFRIADVNIMAALESNNTDESEETPLEIATGGLDRSIKLLEETIRDTRIKQNEYEDIVHHTLPATLHKLSQFMLNRSYNEFELQDKALQVKQKAQNWQNRLQVFWATFAEKTELFWRFTTKKTAGIRSLVARYLGFKSENIVSTREKRNLAEYLATASSEKSLPFVYKNLFRADYSIDQRFYVLPDLADQNLTSAYEEWNRQTTTSANIIISGEKGSGKTSVLRYFENQYSPKHKIITISVDQTLHTEKDLLAILCNSFGFKVTENREEFIDKIFRRKKRSIVIFENLQNIFVRNINGFNALDSFWVIMSATRSNMFWMVTVSRYSWNFIKKISGADLFFSHIVEVDTLNPQKITKAILLRHKATGYDLFFEENNAIQKTRAYKKWQHNSYKTQLYLKDLFFERLAKIAEGNISIAIIIWLQSIKKIEGNTFHISPVEIAEVDKLETPSRDVLFSLASLVIHDRLFPGELALSLHQDSSISSLMLTRLKSNGIVVETDGGFALNHLVYRQVVRILKRRNIIH